MNNKKIKLFAIALLLLSGLLVFAASHNWLNNRRAGVTDLPDGKEELKKIYAAYLDKDSAFNISGKIRLYDEENNNAFKEETNFHYIKTGQQYYYELGYLQMAFDGHLFVQIDSLVKSVSVSKVPDSILLKTAQSGLPLESLMNDTSANKMNVTVSETNKLRTLKLSTELNPDIKSFSITYDPLSYKILSAQIEWWKKESPVNESESDKMVWLTKMDYTYAPLHNFSVESFVNKVLKVEKDNIVLSDLYKDYQIQTTF